MAEGTLASLKNVSYWLRIGAAWLGFVALWLLFVYHVTTSELIAAAVAGSASVFSGVVIFRIVPVCFHARLQWLAQIYRLPGMIAEDLWILFKCLLREIFRMPSRSSFVVAQFSTASDHCEAAAQRALAILFVSTTPNSIVLDIDGESEQLFYHQVGPAPVPALVRRLEE
jgi:multisubunit Na+/H+ antiporter MnhE subunit